MRCVHNYSTERIAAVATESGQLKQRLIDDVVVSLSRCEALIRTLVSLVRNDGGIIPDAEDLFQDSLIQLIKNLNLGMFNGQSSIENYTIGIFKNKWLNFKTKKKEQLIPFLANPGEISETSLIAAIPHPVDAIAPENQMFEDEKKRILEDIVNQLGGKCPELLKRWALRYSIREIAAELGMSEKKVNDRLTECRQKLRNLIAGHKGYQDLVNQLRFD